MKKIDKNKRTTASQEAFFTEEAGSLKSLLLLLVVLIHFPNCGQTAKIISTTPAAPPGATPPNEIVAGMMQQCHALQPDDVTTEDKLVLAPIIFQGEALFALQL